jgi:hypothetical protein
VWLPLPKLPTSFPLPEPNPCRRARVRVRVLADVAQRKLEEDIVGVDVYLE